MKFPIFTRTIFHLLASLLLLVAVPLLSMAQPGNNSCNNDVTLTPGTTCSPTSGTLRTGTSSSTFATATSGIHAFCGNASSPDVWYSFTATTPYPVITLSNMGTNMRVSPRLQLFGTTSCTVSTQNNNSLACVAGSNVTSLSLDVATDVGGIGLTVGTTYLVRVFTNGNSVSAGNAASWNFSICVTDPVAPVPSNDDCEGAITLPVNASCSNVAGTVSGSTPSGTPVSTCGGNSGYDVWYKFVAVSTSETITISGFGANFTNRRLQLFKGSCGSLTSISCTTSSSIAATGLTIGDTLFVRVWSSSTNAPNNQGNFNICVTTTSPPPRYGNSYVNLSKKRNGGVVQKGDTLEIRMTVNHKSGTLYRLRYVDNIPTNTQMLSGTGDSIRIITNEGLTYKKYTATDGLYDDAATYVSAPAAGQYNIRMNIGFANTPPGTPSDNTPSDLTGANGQMASSNNPRGGGGLLFATSFRVVVTGNPGDTITLGTGKFIYRTASSGGSDVELVGTPYKILISNPLSLCDNAIGLNNAQESGGTFGSGTVTNRATDLTNPIAGYTFVQMSSTQSIGDGQYGIVKNMSPRSSTNQNANKQPNCGSPPADFDCNNRMHGGYWAIDGDHSGTNNAIGNPPPAPGDPGGYMLLVNADYVASEAYRQSLTGLCPNTYYEFSAWIRNVCPTCGSDSLAVQTNKPGVYPNLTFALDDIDRYSTGEVDTLGWIKKGFVFLTGASQTSVTFSIRNNSQGGGGNDWAMDDISVRTCLPYMAYNPSASPNVCIFNATTVYDTVRSFFNNYVYYKWQRSTDAGTNWTDITLPQGPAPTSFNVSHNAYEYLTHYVIPPSWSSISNNGDLYRVIAATTVDNLSSSNCVVTDGISFLTLNVLNCGTPLKTDILSFNGRLVSDLANVNWTTSKEEEPVKYEIERSTDGVNFVLAGVVTGFNNTTNATNDYTFVDPVAVSGKIYYRLAVVASGRSKKYSRTILLSKYADNSFMVTNVLNPFQQEIEFNVTSPSDSRIDAELIDLFGKIVMKKSFVVHAGLNSLSIPDTGLLPNGTYFLRVGNNEQVISKKILKQERL